MLTKHLEVLGKQRSERTGAGSWFFSLFSWSQEVAEIQDAQ